MSSETFPIVAVREGSDKCLLLAHLRASVDVIVLVPRRIPTSYIILRSAGAQHSFIKYVYNNNSIYVYYNIILYHRSYG